MKEKISSLVDDELDDPILQQELDALVRGGSELDAFQRYNMIGAAIRGQMPASTGFANGELAARVAHALKDEPTRIAPAVVANNIDRDETGVSRGSTSSGWLGAAAIAATVAAVVVFGLNSGPIQPVTPDTRPIATTESVSGGTTSGTTDTAPNEIVKWETGGTHWSFVSGDNAIAQAAGGQGSSGRNSNGVNAALNAMLVEHAEFVPASGMNGLTAYARFVSYDSEAARSTSTN